MGRGPGLPGLNDWANALYMFAQTPQIGMNASAASPTTSSCSCTPMAWASGACPGPARGRKRAGEGDLGGL